MHGLGLARVLAEKERWFGETETMGSDRQKQPKPDAQRVEMVQKNAADPMVCMART
jgi:hypothetical protein